MQEIWKDIIGFEGLYEVSNLGNVKSLPKKGSGGHNGKILKNSVNGKGYIHFFLRKNKKNTILYCHRLVAQAFLGLDINNKKILVCHKDDNPLNNIVDNLFLGNNKDNMEDMINKGRGISQIKKKCLLKYKKNKIEDFDKDGKYNDEFILF